MLQWPTTSHQSSIVDYMVPQDPTLENNCIFLRESQSTIKKKKKRKKLQYVHTHILLKLTHFDTIQLTHLPITPKIL